MTEASDATRWWGAPEFLGGLQEAVLVEDAERRVLFANAAFAALFLGDAPPEVMIGVDCGAAARQSAEAFVDVSAWIEDTERIVVARLPVTGQLWQMASGRWVERDYIPRFHAEAFLGHSWVYRDVTDRESMRQQIADLEHDLELVQRPGRTGRAAAVESAVRAVEQGLRSGEVTVAVAKIENLDLINADIGYEAADDLLGALPARIHAALPLCQVERLSGSTFAVVCNKSPRDVIAGIHAAVGPTASGRGRTAMVNVLVGAARSASDGRDPRVYVQNARLALREARRKGSDVILDEAALAATLHRDRLALALPGALSNDELRMVYQPVVWLADRATVVHEALVRWDHPASGTIAAGSFIPAAETLGVIAGLDQWVIDRVVREASDVLGRGGTRVGVNVSGRTLNTADMLAPLILGALQRHGLPPERLVVEVTESAVARHTAEGFRALHELAEAGVTIAIDDFGVGSSSLATLKDVPFHFLKLDKTFAHSIADERVPALVSVMNAMATDLGALVVAEGIEHEEQAERMLECGVALGQGWLLGMPT